MRDGCQRARAMGRKAYTSGQARRAPVALSESLRADWLVGYDMARLDAEAAHGYALRIGAL
jgi:hypothetical protein